jgi:hypothetical protein
MRRHDTPWRMPRKRPPPTLISTSSASRTRAPSVRSAWRWFTPPRLGPKAKIPNDDVTRLRFARDSPLEEAVLSELVSEAKFPASWENTGNFIRLGLRVRLLARNPRPNSRVYNPIPYASEQGIYFGRAGN